MIQIEIPVLDEPLPGIPSLQAVAVVDLEFQLAPTTDVIQVASDN